MALINTYETAGRCICALSGEFNIYSAQRLKGELLALLAEQNSLDIDLSGVDDFDSAALQLLLLLKREALQGERELRLTGHSPVICEVLDLLNLRAELDAPAQAGEAQP
ncbi:lipid asymmetry maintenance protein MlaB [Pseudomonas sp. 5P_3.1_Bac2]|uniref:STAS domain-containing protein n=1 Tax=Pseudomonas sp. 5P_3.1_Bac2 TaxID=2971617 RepID=UPI0021C81DAA|nr:STAS domain-containing protein [Pseudomonas sp. 5P_3.1_Bac2]MCU1719422.1 STAS domain-containing protein [Pseudomonas sp. 5P_3.1_Bac2]